MRIKFENLESKTNQKFEKLIEDLLTKDEVEIEGSSSSDIGKILSRQLEHQQVLATILLKNDKYVTLLFSFIYSPLITLEMKHLVITQDADWICLATDFCKV